MKVLIINGSPRQKGNTSVALSRRSHQPKTGCRHPDRRRNREQTLLPDAGSQDSGFLHTYKTHEELYIILKGEGEYQVDCHHALHPVQG